MDQNIVWGYDIETYPNFISAGFQNLATGERCCFEMSPRVDQAQELWNFLYTAQMEGHTHLGYNSNSFDYTVLHLFMSLCYDGVRPTVGDLYNKAQAIIDAPRGDWSHSLWESDHMVRQIDVFKLMHFNRMGATVSLKQLEVVMRSRNVKDLPLVPGHDVPPELYDPMLSYMMTDVSETSKFALLIWDRIEFRLQLDKELGGRTRISKNDVQIGSDYLLDELRKAGIRTHDGKVKRQTPRKEGIRFADFLPEIPFDSPDLQRIASYMQATTIKPDQTKGYFEDLSATVDGFKMSFGLGGLHGAIPKRTWRSSTDRIIQLRDVESYYPRVAATQGIGPAHFGSDFVHHYNRLFHERKKHAKGTNENALFKLALNGSFGKMNDKYSPLYDPQAMLAITLTGQLFLARLTEVLMRIPSLEMIQVNTDGVAYTCDRADVVHADAICTWWEDWTGLRLEADEYVLFAQRDVNNYMAIDPDGGVKCIGAYRPVTERKYSQDVSAGVVQIAVREFVVNGTPLDQTIYTHPDPFDFMLSVKVNRSSALVWGGEPTQRICRYYIALKGRPLVKVMPPLKGEVDDREFQVNAGWTVGLCNDAAEFDWHDLNRRWYLNEAEALVAGLGI